MADNRNYGQQFQHPDWDMDRERFDRQDQYQHRSQPSGYGDQLKGGYGGSEYGNTYYRADYNVPGKHRSDYGQDDNRRYGSYYGSAQYRSSGGDYNTRYGNDYYPGGHARVGNTGGSHHDSGWYGNSRNFDQQRSDMYRHTGEGYRNDRREEGDWWDRTKNQVSSWFGNDEGNRQNTDRRMTGEHRGKGPRGYQRSSDRIREDVCDRLTEDPFLDASNIEIQVQGNEVILTGTVNSKEDKRRAEDLVESITGVRNVENRIRVERNERGANADERTYTSTDDIGIQSGTTNEIIRNTNNAKR